MDRVKKLHQRQSLPVLSSDEPFREHIFLRLSSSERRRLPNPVSVLRQPPSDDQNEPKGRWGAVRSRFFLAKERHSFLFLDKEPFLRTQKRVFPRDRVVGSPELRPAEKDTTRWKKEWLRRKTRVVQGGLERCSSDQGAPSSQKTMGGRGIRREAAGVFELICKHREPATGSDETIITRARSEGSVHALPAPGSNPRRSWSIHDGASGARGAQVGVHPRLSWDNHAPSLTTYYHLMRAKFPNVCGCSQDGSHTAAESLSTRDRTARAYINRSSSADDHPPISQSTPPLPTPASARISHARVALLRVPNRRVSDVYLNPNAVSAFHESIGFDS